jgi:DNA gyrase subunit B
MPERRQDHRRQDHRSGAREAARKARDMTRARAYSTAWACPATGRPPRKDRRCEIYLVEGDSAGGSAKQDATGNFRRFAAQGKILNVEKRAMKAADQQTKSDFDHCPGHRHRQGRRRGRHTRTTSTWLLRYHRIIIMTDADVDGAHIRTLLLTPFFHRMPELIRRGPSVPSRRCTKSRPARKSST